MIRVESTFKSSQFPTNITRVRRHKFSKPKYKVTNWTEYNDALRRRGDITIWFTEEAIEQWRPVKLGARGRPQVYADHAIETAILIRQVFHLPLRQTDGFMNSVARLMKAEISIPDFSSISKSQLQQATVKRRLEQTCTEIIEGCGSESNWRTKRSPGTNLEPSHTA